MVGHRWYTLKRQESRNIWHSRSDCLSHYTCCLAHQTLMSTLEKSSQLNTLVRLSLSFCRPFSLSFNMLLKTCEKAHSLCFVCLFFVLFFRLLLFLAHVGFFLRGWKDASPYRQFSMTDVDFQFAYQCYTAFKWSSCFKHGKWQKSPNFLV